MSNTKHALKEAFIEAGFVRKKFFGLIKTKELDPKLEMLIDSGRLEAIATSDIDDNYLIQIMSYISDEHMNIEFKRYTGRPELLPTLTIEVDGVVRVWEIKNDLKTDLKGILLEAVAEFRNNSSVKNYF